MERCRRAELLLAREEDQLVVREVERAEAVPSPSPAASSAAEDPWVRRDQLFQ